MAERLLIAALLIGLGSAVYFGQRRRQLQRAGPKLLGLENRRNGVPVILYFTTPTCAPCKTIQRPALDSLRDEFGERVQIVTIDAAANLQIADHWGVLTIPTTFIFDAAGTPQACNMGVANAAKLRGQLEAVGLVAERRTVTSASTQPVLEN